MRPLTVNRPIAISLGTTLGGLIASRLVVLKEN